MPSNLNLDYYYGTEADQYSFYRIPKTLLTDPRYKSVSIEAKVLYGLLLDRMGLSVKNGWMDSDKRVYIYFTQEDAMNLMGCGKDKATKLFRELDKDGIGLIERKKQGQGRPTRIYVKNFILPPEPGQPQQSEEAPPSTSPPAGRPKSRFLKLNHEHIAYVLDSLSQNTTLVKNIKAYTLAALYNAPTTISQYYASLVSHDLAQEAAGI